VRSTGGDYGEAELVARTNGSIGFSSLARARFFEFGRFSQKTQDRVPKEKPSVQKSLEKPEPANLIPNTPSSKAPATKDPSSKEPAAKEPSGDGNEPSGGAGAGMVALDTTSTQQLVTLKLKAEQQTLAHVGEAAPVTRRAPGAGGGAAQRVNHSHQLHTIVPDWSQSWAFAGRTY
jgi:hypothetical protein